MDDSALRRNVIGAFASWGRLDGLQFDQTPEVARLASELPIPLFNVLLFPQLANRQRVASWVRPFEGRQLPYSWLLRSSERNQEFFQFGADAAVERMPAMELAIRDASHSEHSDVELSVVGEEREFFEWLETFAAGFAIPRDGAELLRGWFAESGKHGDWSFHLAKIGGRAIACSSCFFTADSVGLYNVATLDNFRRRGIGTSLTRFSIEHARQRGADRMFLFSSPAGTPVYRALGFKELFMLDSITVPAR